MKVDSGAAPAQIFTTEQAAQRWHVHVFDAEKFLARFAACELVVDTVDGWLVTEKGRTLSHDLQAVQPDVPDNSQPARRV